MIVLRKITREVILHFIQENKIKYDCTQTKLCVPIIDRIYRKIIAGIRFSEIKIDGELICDGHHRYLASLLAGCTIMTIPSVRTSATKIVAWKEVLFDDEDWDTPAKIRILNEQDAEYNNITIEKLGEMLQ